MLHVEKLDGALGTRKRENAKTIHGVTFLLFYPSTSLLHIQDELDEHIISGSSHAMRFSKYRLRQLVLY
jgi:hypothetical protein